MQDFRDCPDELPALGTRQRAWFLRGLFPAHRPGLPTRLRVLALFFLIGWNLIQYALDLRRAGVSFAVIYRGVVPFLAGLVLCAALLFLFPQLATWLPGLLMK